MCEDACSGGIGGGGGTAASLPSPIKTWTMSIRTVMYHTIILVWSLWNFQSRQGHNYAKLCGAVLNWGTEYAWVFYVFVYCIQAPLSLPQMGALCGVQWDRLEPYSSGFTGEEGQERDRDRWLNTHHLLVVGVINLVDQWELLWTQLLVQSGQLSELIDAWRHAHRHTYRHKHRDIFYAAIVTDI